MYLYPSGSATKGHIVMAGLTKKGEVYYAVIRLNGFAATLELKIFRKFERDPESILRYILDNFTFDQSGHGFSEKEMLRTIKSALLPHYTCAPSRHKLAQWGLIDIPENETYPGPREPGISTLH